jgi:ribA/ribD-fused uncharacterized protein
LIFVVSLVSCGCVFLSFNVCYVSLQAASRIRPDWEEIKEAVMLSAITAKFKQNDPIRAVLLATGSRTLIENSPVDYYWGCGKTGTGRNRLGVLLMRVREELRSSMGIGTYVCEPCSR